MNNNIRVRFAPSPTGKLHIGAARVGLFNFIFAKKNNGQFLLRIDDTDKERSTKENEENIMRSLDWLNISWDENPVYQSQRKEIYKKYIKKLLDEGSAYYCFCTKEELEKEREKQREAKTPPRYSGQCYKLTKEEQEKMTSSGQDFTIRVRISDKEQVEFDDEIRGKVKFRLSDIGGDFVIAKKDLSALYNFASAIDDYEMKITHVIRGEDHISNTPKQIVIFNAIGAKSPKFAHLPMILAEDKSKLSKRHNAPSITEYKEKGYLKEAVINFIALLGWNPDEDNDIFPMKKIIEKFSLKDCQKSGAVYSEKKLDYINGHHIRKLDIEELTNLCLPYLKKNNLIERDENKEKLKEIISLYQERMKKLSEISDLTDYFFKDELDYQEELFLWKKQTKKDTLEALKKGKEALKSIKKWDKESIESTLLDVANKEENRGNILWPIRVALSGKKSSAGPFDIVRVLGKERSLKRIEKAEEFLKNS